jgi:hypothetical protein
MLSFRNVGRFAEEFPNERVLDGGPAKCPVLDQRHTARVDAAFGDDSPHVRKWARSKEFLASEWVATDRRFAYMQMLADGMFSWEWHQIASLDLTRSSLLTARVRLAPREEDVYNFSLESGTVVHKVLDDESYDISLGKRAARSLMDIAHHFMGP